mmetsp:Transcript_88427/g.249177  ORF Transcript_88427/g.249177 Transcript_88427/m.249177 type:complete len:377 (-) Transcript_88427:105-1235(-)
MALKATEPPTEPTRSFILYAVLFYASCSSTMLVFNKIAMHLVPNASFLLFCQFAFVILVVHARKWCRPDLDIELLKWEKVRPFAPAVFVFFICLLSNNKALKGVNVETIIVVRSCSPIAVAILDYVALARDLPNVSGILALFGIMGGALIYANAEGGFRSEDALWLVVYFVSIVVEMVFVKFVVDTVPMSTWTRVYYNSALSLPLASLSAFCTGDLHSLNMDWGLGDVVAVLMTCIGGVAIAYAGFNLRKAVSATTFTVVGVVCKIFTVLINDLIWTQHSTLVGHVGLLVCIASGFLYERSKPRSGVGWKQERAHASPKLGNCHAKPEGAITMKELSNSQDASVGKALRDLMCDSGAGQSFGDDMDDAEEGKTLVG